MTKKDLEKKSLYELRLYGRNIGVRCATALVKNKLIKAILEIENGIREPYYTTKGRPAYDNDFEIGAKRRLTKSEKDKIDLLLLNLKRELIAIFEGEKD